MFMRFLFRRAVALVGLVVLTLGTTALVAAPAQAVTPVSQLTVSPSTAQPGDLVTVTQTVTNNLGSLLLQPVAQLVSSPSNLTSYTRLVGCSGAVGCALAKDGGGTPIGYQAVLPAALGALGGSSVVTYTLQVLPEAPDLTQTLQGRLLGLGFLSDLIDGATLIIDQLPGPPPAPLLPISQLSISPATAAPGDIVTVTQTVTNNLAATLLQPVARLLSGPDELPLYASLESCSGALSCSVLNNASGQPIGYQAVLPAALGALGGSSVVTYQLKILDGVPDLQETLQGQLLGLNFLSAIIDGLLLIVDAPIGPPVSQLSVSPSTAHPGDIVTVTQTVTNTGLRPLLQAAGRLFSKPSGLLSYATLLGCDPPAVCSMVSNGGVVGYQGLLSAPIGPRLGTSVLTYRFKILPEAPDLEETLQGQLLGLDFLSGLIDGVTLIVDANSDAAVSVVATPQPGLLQRNLDIAVTVTNNGPGLLRAGTFSTALPSNLVAAGSGPCLPFVGEVICTVPTLAKGASTTMHFTVPLNLLSIGLPYTFTSSRTASVSRDLNPVNDTASTSCTVLTPLLVNCT
jgi:hypothetical protein